MTLLDSIRIALLLSLSILFVFMLFRLFKNRTMARDLPVRQHAELLGVQVLHHPARLRVEVRMPRFEAVHLSLLSMDDAVLHQWPQQALEKGDHAVELSLIDRPADEYYLLITTDSQTTRRRFQLKGE
jgi:hypothetical protein